MDDISFFSVNSFKISVQFFNSQIIHSFVAADDAELKIVGRMNLRNLLLLFVFAIFCTVNFVLFNKVIYKYYVLIFCDFFSLDRLRELNKVPR